MITREELNEIKEKRKNNLYYEEKEYLQYIFLNAISRYGNFVFKGGTCLRICYGLERASEDLDFNTNLSVRGIKKMVKKCLGDFDYLNIGYEIYSEKEFEGNLRIEIRFKGPLFQGDLRSTNTLKIDFNKGKVKNKIVKIVQKLFSDVPLFSIIVMDEREILAEKVRALAKRAEPRDFYDVFMLINKKVKMDKKLVYWKLREENAKLSAVEFPSKEEYNQTLKNLVVIVPNYEQVRKEVLEAVRKLK